MTPIVIAGGGLAGAAAACDLAQHGQPVRVIERNLGPVHKICGDFLSAEAQHYLRRLGLDAAGLGVHPISRVRVAQGAHLVQAALPFTAIGLSRRVLDEALLTHAAALGAEVQRGVALASLTPDITCLATGKHDLRGSAREPHNIPEELVGFKTYLRLAPDQIAALRGHVEVILFRRGYAGLQLVEGEQANLCLLIHRDHLAQVGGTWAALLAALCLEAPHLARRLRDAVELLEKPITIARVPYGFIHRPQRDERVFRLGDQACVIPSFTGDGMSMALHSAALAVRSLRAGQSAFEYHQLLAHDVTGPIRRAWTLYRLGRAGPGRAVLIHALRLWPGLLSQTAALTRVARRNWVEDSH